MDHIDEQIQIWNILHDGEITAIEKKDGDTVIMFVNIPYLRRRIKPLGDSFVLTLEGVMDFGYKDFDGNKSKLHEEIEIASVEILSTDSESMPIKVFTTMGELTLNYKCVRLSLDTGQEVSFQMVSKICEEYWEEFEERRKDKK